MGGKHSRAPRRPNKGRKYTYVSTCCNCYHILYQRFGSWASHGLHYKEALWLRLRCNDVTDAHRNGAKIKMGSGPNLAQCKPVALLTLMNTLIRVECSLLVLNDIRIIYGKCLNVNRSHDLVMWAVSLPSLGPFHRIYRGLRGLLNTSQSHPQKAC